MDSTHTPERGTRRSVQPWSRPSDRRRETISGESENRGWDWLKMLLNEDAGIGKPGHHSSLLKMTTQPLSSVFWITTSSLPSCLDRTESFWRATLRVGTTFLRLLLERSFRVVLGWWCDLQYVVHMVTIWAAALLKWWERTNAKTKPSLFLPSHTRTQIYKSEHVRFLRWLCWVSRWESRCLALHCVSGVQFLPWIERKQFFVWHSQHRYTITTEVQTF